jgi:hypothetical protein
MIWIKSAAIQTSDGQVLTGVNHPQCLIDMRKKGLPWKGYVQGFTTSEGTFVTRKDLILPTGKKKILIP